MRNFKAIHLILILFFALSVPQLAEAFGFGSPSQNNDQTQNQNPMTARARFQPSAIEAGGTAELIIELDLAKGFHAYSDRFKLVVESPDDLKVDQYKVAPVVPFKDAVSKSIKDGVEGHAILRAVVEVPVGAKSETIEAKVKLTYQACTSEFCLFPKSIALTAPIQIKSGTPASTTAMAASAPADDSNFKSALDRGLFTAFAFMFVVGFMTSLTPCIYPMIPITLAVLGVRAPRGGRKPSVWRSFSIAVVYVLGLAVTYSTLGVVAAKTGGLFGSALANPYVITTIALVFVAMGVGMYGLFEVQAPAFIRNRLGGQSGAQTGYVAAFTTGLIAGVVASPCIGPVLVSVLAYIAQTQNVTLGFSLLFAFALGMGVIFIVLGLFGNLLARLPRAGGWMDGVKYLFGTIMIAMAFYYIFPIYPRWLFTSLLGVASFLLASFFGAFDPLEKPVTNADRMRKGLMLALFFVGVLLTAGGVLSKAELLPTRPAVSTSTDVKSEALPWKPYSEAAFADALKSGQPVLIDFMAEWCGACTELEELTYPKLKNEMNQFVLFKLDATTNTPEIDATIKKFGVAGLPTLLFFDKQGRALPQLTLTGFEDADGFRSRLSQANP